MKRPDNKPYIVAVIGFFAFTVAVLFVGYGYHELQQKNEKLAYYVGQCLLNSQPESR